MRQTRGHTLSRAGELRVLVALAVQPFVCGSVAFVCFSLLAPTFPAAAHDPNAARSVAIAVGIVAIPATVLLALPAFAWMLHRGPISLGQTLFSGLVIGNIPAPVIGMVVAADNARRGRPTTGTFLPGMIAAAPTLIFGTIIGGASAYVFWLIAGDHLSGDSKS